MAGGAHQREGRPVSGGCPSGFTNEPDAQTLPGVRTWLPSLSGMSLLGMSQHSILWPGARSPFANVTPHFNGPGNNHLEDLRHLPPGGVPPASIMPKARICGNTVAVERITAHITPSHKARAPPLKSEVPKRLNPHKISSQQETRSSRLTTASLDSLEHSTICRSLLRRYICLRRCLWIGSPGDGTNDPLAEDVTFWRATGCFPDPMW